MTLDVTEPTGLSATEEQQNHLQWDTMAAVQQALYDGVNGFMPPERPMYQIPKVSPTDLANATSQNYSSWFMAYAAWQSYMSYQMNWIDGLILQRKNEMEVLAAKIRVKTRQVWDNKEPVRGQKRPSEDAISDLVITDARHIQLRHELQQLSQRKELMAPQYEDVKTTLRLMSRSMEGRKLEAELSGRSPVARQAGWGQ